MIWPFSKFYYLHSSIYIIYIYQQIDFRFFLFFIIIYIYTILYTILYNIFHLFISSSPSSSIILFRLFFIHQFIHFHLHSYTIIKQSSHSQYFIFYLYSISHIQYDYLLYYTSRSHFITYSKQSAIYTFFSTFLSSLPYISSIYNQFHTLYQQSHILSFDIQQKKNFHCKLFIYILNQINQWFLQAFYKLDFVLTNYIPLLELVQPLFLYISFLTHFSSFFIFFIFQPIIFKFHSNFNFVYSLSSFLYIILIAFILHPTLHSTSHSPLFITNYSQIIDFDFNPLLISFSSPHPILIDLYSSTIYFILHFHPLHYDITQFSPLFILFFQFHLLISFL